MADVIRIGVFFDGTGNNIWNDEKIGDGSQTNVAKLYRMYEAKQKNGEGYRAIYAEGAGTEAYKDGVTFNDTQLTAIKNQEVYKDRKDYYDIGGLAFGTTVKQHAIDKLNEIKTVIDQYPKDQKIIIDVYGFSRGATSARDFINMFNAQYADVTKGSAIGFVGLFDTVATVGAANAYNYNLNLNLNTNSAQQMVHLTANNEFRANFPLNKMGSSGSNMVEIGMIGAHADIGGGYGNSKWDTQERYIYDDPTDPKYVTISVSNAQAVESAGTMGFIISLSEVLSQDITIDLITQDGSATNGSDYTPNKRVSVTIAAGNRSAYYEVAILNDEVPEDTENFTLAPYLSADYTGPEQVLLSNVGVGTIYDDDDPEYITAHISSASAKEAAEYMSFTVSLSHELERDITIETSLGAVTIKAGERSGKVYSTWKNDAIVEPDAQFEVTMTGHNYQGGQYQVLLVNTATGTIIDDDPEPEPEPHPLPYNPDKPQPHDPLVLDLNQDGKISTIALSDSQVYFDITGDGVKERVGWVAPEDGFLVYDKNMNGKIEGIGEVFGKDGISGFAELRQVADTNYDNIIDRRDALFSQLKVYQDGISQASELKTLSQAVNNQIHPKAAA